MQQIDKLYINLILLLEVTPSKQVSLASQLKKSATWHVWVHRMKETPLCGRQLNSDWVITVLTVIVLVGCWLTWLLAFVQRGKEELREATALLTAQQTSLEIIVNMCCSDGECCGHGQQCWPQALCINIIPCDTATQYVFVYRRDYYNRKYTLWVYLLSCISSLLINSVHVCMFRPLWRRVGRGVEQWWERHGSRWPLWWSFQPYVSTVSVSWGPWGLNLPQHPWKGK